MKKWIPVLVCAFVASGLTAAETTKGTTEGFDPAKVWADCQQAVKTGDAPDAFFEFCAEKELELTQDIKANREGAATNRWFRPIRRHYWCGTSSWGYGHSGYGHYGSSYHYSPKYSHYGYGHTYHSGGYGYVGYGHYGKTHYGHYGYGHVGHYHYGHHYSGGYGAYHPW